MLWTERSQSETAADYWLGVVAAAIADVTRGRVTRAGILARPNDRLGANLELTSIEVARLVSLLLRRVSSRPLPFHVLLIDGEGEVLSDIRVADVAAFLRRYAEKPAREPQYA